MTTTASQIFLNPLLLRTISEFTSLRSFSEVSRAVREANREFAFHYIEEDEDPLVFDADTRETFLKRMREPETQLVSLLSSTNLGYEGDEEGIELLSKLRFSPICISTENWPVDLVFRHHRVVRIYNSALHEFLSLVPNVEELRLDTSRYNETISGTILTQLPRLKKLDITGYRWKEDPCEITSIEHVTADAASAKFLSVRFPAATSLRVVVQAPKVLTDLRGNFPMLKEIAVIVPDSFDHFDLALFKEFPHLSKVTVKFPIGVTTLVSRLKRLSIFNNDYSQYSKYKRIDGRNCPPLTHLELEGPCDVYEPLADVAPKCKEIKMRCPMIEFPRTLMSSNLRTLEIVDGCIFTGIDGIEAAVNLVVLKLMNCYRVKSFAPILSLTNLEVLNLADTRFSETHLLSNKQKLRSLNLANTNTKSLALLKNCPELAIVDVSGSNVTSIQVLLHVPSLREVDIRGLKLHRHKALYRFSSHVRVIGDEEESKYLCSDMYRN